VNIDTVSPVTDLAMGSTPGLDGWLVGRVVLDLEPISTDLSGVSYTIYRLDGGDWTAFVDQLTVLSDGQHVFDYQSADRAGNVETMRTTSFRLDATAPYTSISFDIQRTAYGWFGGPVNISLASMDLTSGTSNIWYSVDNGSWKGFDHPIRIVTDGTHRIGYYATDNASNWEAASYEDVHIDSTPPVISFITVSGAIFTASTATIAWFISDISGGGTVRVSVDGGQSIIYQGSVTEADLASLSDGMHSVNVSVTDLAGNTGMRTLTFNVNTDPLSPDGPMGIWLLVLIAVAAIVGLAIFIRRRREV
jgi:hypothetical protein